MYLIHNCQIIKRIIHIHLRSRDVDWMSSFGDRDHTERNIAPARGEAVEVRRVMVSVVAEDFYCTDDIWHLIMD